MLHATLYQAVQDTCIWLQEFFDAGAAMAVTSFWTARDGRYEVRFKARWRHDGLVRRTEDGNGKLVEDFEGRADGMVYRSTRFSARAPTTPEHMAGVWCVPSSMCASGQKDRQDSLCHCPGHLDLQEIIDMNVHRRCDGICLCIAMHVASHPNVNCPA